MEDSIEILYFDKEGQYVEILGHKIDRTYKSFEDFEHEMKSLIEFKKEIDNHTYYDIKKMNARHIYDALCRDLSFNNMIELYRLLTNKINCFRDEPYDYEEETCIQEQ